MIKNEYNLLTKELLAEGYTADRYPDHVRIAGSGWDKSDPLLNLTGGFEYKSSYLSDIVFETGCGLLIKGSHFLSGNMAYMGITWSPENNNAVFNCPYRKIKCICRNPLLDNAEGGGVSKFSFCDCHRSSKKYSYENSVDFVIKQLDEERKRKYQEFSDRVHGHVCFWHMYYDEWERKWNQHYDPSHCAKLCTKSGSICDFTHKEISKKRGNVFYDVKFSYIRNDDTLFNGQEVVSIKKGIRYFEANVSLTICENFVKMCKGEIYQRERDRYSVEIMQWKARIEILNIRAETRESRDLMQDLADISNGITISYCSDEERVKKQIKKEKRVQNNEKRIQRLEKKILNEGYDSFQPYDLDKIHADKWLGKERIMELQNQRQVLLKETAEQPVQMTLFDIFDMN